MLAALLLLLVRAAACYGLLPPSYPCANKNLAVVMTSREPRNTPSRYPAVSVFRAW